MPRPPSPIDDQLVYHVIDRGNSRALVSFDDRVGRSCRKISMSGQCGWSLTTYAPVPGSPTPRELAVADGSARKYRIGPWSSWGIRCEKKARAPPKRKGGARCEGCLTQANHFVRLDDRARLAE